MHAPTSDHSPAVSPLAPEWLSIPRDPSALDAGVWSRTAHRDDDGMLAIGGVRADELLRRFGSPLYVIDEEDARGRATEAVRDFGAAFERIGTDVELHYAAKALLTGDIARWMTEAGLGIDVASPGEMAVALAAGVDPAVIHLHGNNKPDAVLRMAVEAGIGSIIVDSLEELDRLARLTAALDRDQSVLVRVNSGIHAHTHDYLATSGEDQKFGLDFESTREAVARIRRSPSLQLLGLHSHIGSSIYGSAGFGAAADRLMRLRAELLASGPVPEVNLGGGFGIAYLPSDEAPALKDLADGIAAEVARACADTGTDVPRIVFEPGRALIGPAGTTLYTLGTTKSVEVPIDGGDTAVRRYLSVDGGMSDNARPALYEADYTVRVANRVPSGEPVLSRVVGSHCEAGDIVVRADYLPADTSPGDLLAVPATGAYCFSLSSSYNYLERPAIVAVRDGDARVLVRRLTVADYLDADAGISAP